MSTTPNEIDQLDHLIKLAKENIEELEQRRKELKDSLVPADQRVANLLHGSLCNANHIDQCSWSYESWENPGATRKRYLAKAQMLLSEYTFEDISRAFEIIVAARRL